MNKISHCNRVKEYRRVLEIHFSNFLYVFECLLPLPNTQLVHEMKEFTFRIKIAELEPAALHPIYGTFCFVVICDDPK